MKVNHRIHPRSSRTTTIPSILLLTSILLHPTPPNTTTPPPLFASAQGKFPSGYITPTAETHCWTPCQTTPPDTNVAVPDTNCKLFYVCRQGRVTNRLTCSEGRLFDSNIAACNHEGLVECIDPRCPPTARPTRSPSVSPTEFPTEFPTESPTKFPTWTPTDSPSETPTSSPSITPAYAISFLKSKQSLMEQHVFQSYSPIRNLAYPSTRYVFDDFLLGLKKIGVQGFNANFKFLLWDNHEVWYKVGLVNVAAFLAQATVEAVGDDTCDELNWQQVAGRHAISNSCGQEGRSYQDETCAIYSCDVDTSMEVTAVSSTNQVRAPPPFECRPSSGGSNSYAGYWNTNTGTEIKNTPYSNTAGRIDVEGCCYWGRGALLTRGSCNIGKLNYYLGARAAREGRRSMYPNIDFCTDPEATCASSFTQELRWTTALFEWAERVQRYNTDGWSYEDELFKFYDNGMTDDSFIDAVGRVFSRGCHAEGCSDLDVRAADKRKSNFFLIINNIFEVANIKTPTRSPTRMPTVPTPRPVDPITLRPTPRPLTPPVQMLPQAPPPTPPTNPPVIQYPAPGLTVPGLTVPGPTMTTTKEPPSILATQTPAGTMPNGQPSGTADSNGTTDATQLPTILETVYILEPNGAERPALLHCSYAMVLLGATAIQLLLTMY
eukprot:CAMPEP_0196140386 /NCGR_PEP_ID=MMETSP0910-20130528/7307_1 /TAXON_ID=49265 /ORGANISM="Thalassiosira rotula, Strain GSO102" /LENGTH=661 /DNA_ID=CAMNT_0041401237 /DNA_START=34 /DNA_END=2019 /DNA_ORIENTATION=+